MRRAIVVLAVVAAPVALATVTVADAGARRPVPPPPPGAAGAGPAAVQADVARKARPATAQTALQRGNGWRADDAATPPSPGTTPAMSASSHPGATAAAATAPAALPLARAPPAVAPSEAGVEVARGRPFARPRAL